MSVGISLPWHSMKGGANMEWDYQLAIDVEKRMETVSLSLKGTESQGSHSQDLLEVSIHLLNNYRNCL